MSERLYIYTEEALKADHAHCWQEANFGCLQCCICKTVLPEVEQV